MKRLKKLIVAAIVVLILVIVVTVVWIDRIAKVGVEAGGRFAFGVPTKLDSASIGILTGRSELTGLDIANPEGFSTPHLLKMDDAVLAVSLGSLTGDTVEIPEFSLAGIDLNLESKGGKSNFKVVLDSLGRFESSKTEPQAEEEHQGRKFIIREIVIKDVKVHVALLPLGGSATRVTIPIEELQLTNVGTGSDGGLVVAQVAGTLLKAIILAAMEKGSGNIPSELLGELNTAMASLAPLKEIGASLAVNIDGALKEMSAQTTEVAQQFTQQAQEATKQIGDTAKDAQQKLTEGLGGLLKKKGDESK